ncbi:hypothetical protein GOPIP_043_00420 [Gordonia polyisoprenivorans NBRC 16320 = JCM 10675]|uniref:Uncharacterized protein n=1 Tax=Gordonia polyisoprenivorans TaxID=84595 RepID=A0A846WSK9_9ACTN|nr:hypothetical protein [Gordonia polyisoprenivorans]NKY04515.1 hypothetical protein [Gordonia polyisoprenivorans]GAB23266.1 hypothetical protein GOPIP_043_00420 [Gordonia polyisoprenivorans NBRC 16320 = JCM 10675]
MIMGGPQFATNPTSVTWQQVKPGMMTIIGIWAVVTVIEVASLAISIVAGSGLAVAATGISLVISVIALASTAFVTRGKLWAWWVLYVLGLMSGVAVFQSFTNHLWMSVAINVLAFLTVMPLSTDPIKLYCGRKITRRRR